MFSIWIPNAWDRWVNYIRNAHKRTSNRARGQAGDNREIHIGGMILNQPVASEKPQQLTPSGHLSNQERFIMPPLGDLPRCLYIPGDSSALPLYKSVHVFPGRIIPELCIPDLALTIPPVQSTGIGEMEITAGNWSASLTAELVEEKWV